MVLPGQRESFPREKEEKEKISGEKRERPGENPKFYFAGGLLPSLYEIKIEFIYYEE